MSEDGEAQLETFLARFDDEVASMARATLARVRRLAPGSVQLVYDAYNALSIPFSASEKLGDAFVAVVVYPRHVNLAFNRGAELDDPKGRLLGEGARIRHVRATAAALKDAEIARLVRAAAANAGLDAKAEERVVVKAVYARQRARKPGSKAKRPG